METQENSQQPVRMTFALPVELAEALDQERLRLASELRTRLSMNQLAARILRLGLEASGQR